MDFREITEDKAREGFGGGIDCSMQVAAHCSHALEMDEKTALKMAAAFGGGMWHGETCGCVTGALMALGLKYGNCEHGDKETKDAFLAKKAAFEAAFTEENGSLICREILGHGLSTPEGMEKIMEANLLMTRCPRLVCSACKIMDDMLK